MAEKPIPDKPAPQKAPPKQPGEKVEKPAQTKPMNLYQKLLAIGDAAGVLRKTKAGFNYRYVPEDEIQAKVTGAMQKFGVMLYQEIVPGTFTVTPYSSEKYDKAASSKKGEPVYIKTDEVMVQAQVLYTWVNTDNPSETLSIPWVIVGQMADASQAFGAAETYCNRYFLMKTFQIATTDDDPDNYRSKQQESAEWEATKAEQEEARKKQKDLSTLNTARKQVSDTAKTLTKAGYDANALHKIIADLNGGEPQSSKIATVEKCEETLKALNAYAKENKIEGEAQT